MASLVDLMNEEVSEPGALSTLSLDMLLSNYTNRLFAIAGRFPAPTSKNAVFLGPRVREGEMGYHVIQPMERDAGGGQVLVDRGFVPKSKIVNVNGDPSTWRLMDVSLNWCALSLYAKGFHCLTERVCTCSLLSTRRLFLIPI